MVKTKTIEQIKANYLNAIPVVASRYKTGVTNTTDWKEKALVGQALYEQRMQDPNVLRGRAAGINKVSNEEWRSKASDLGSSRIGAGMTANADKQSRNFAPHREVLANIELPARTTDPVTNITNRVVPIAVALAAKKRELRGA